MKTISEIIIGTETSFSMPNISLILSIISFVSNCGQRSSIRIVAGIRARIFRRKIRRSKLATTFG